MYTILKIIIDGVEEFIVYNKMTKSEIARYATYDEAFRDILTR